MKHKLNFCNVFSHHGLDWFISRRSTNEEIARELRKGHRGVDRAGLTSELFHHSRRGHKGHQSSCQRHRTRFVSNFTFLPTYKPV